MEGSDWACHGAALFTSGNCLTLLLYTLHTFDPCKGRGLSIGKLLYYIRDMSVLTWFVNVVLRKPTVCHLRPEVCNA